ncbi:MAG: ABC transporter permease [Coriobacteriia bacterium]|nr:ABC transporter permease [Coriobacteriia bacterium]
MSKTFTTTFKVLIRDKGVLLWSVLFPLVLSTLFYSMFNKLDAEFQLDPLPVIIVADENYHKAQSFATLVDGLSGGGAAAATDDTGGGGGDAGALLSVTFVDTQDQALQLMASSDSELYYLGYIIVDSDGMPRYAMDSRLASGLDTFTTIKQSIVLSILDRYIQDYELITAIAASEPQLFADPDFIDTLLLQQSYTFRGSITANPPSDALRYYYAVLAFTCIMMMNFGRLAIDNWKASTSPLGARRALGSYSWVHSLAPTLMAAWVLSMACATIGFLYIRFGFQISFGGKEPACLAVLAASTMVSTFLGALLGAVTIPGGAKSGISAFIANFLSLFAGLYGPASQQLGDFIAREAPILAAINPVRQVSDAFFSLYYYDSYQRFTEILITLGIMVVVFFAASVGMMRKQQYKSL